MTDHRGRARSLRWIGRRGETIAARWLAGQGCPVLARNFRAPGGGEVDLIARDGDLLLFVEVKTRCGDQRIRPLDAVDRPKQTLIKRGACHWRKQLGPRPVAWRFDVIEVILRDGQRPQINQVRDAF